MAGPNQYTKRPEIGLPRVDLAPKDFDSFIEDQGTRVRITPAIVCPRRSGEFTEVGDSNHDLNCPLCFGSMVIDLAPLAVEDWAFIQGIKLDKVWDQNSRFDVKDAFITCRHDQRLSYWFKVEIVDFGSLFNQTILRGPSDTDKLRYPTKELYDGTYFSLMDHDGTVFVKDTDYSITGDVLTWLTSNRPVPDKLYSFLYPVTPTFRVLEMMHETRYYYDGFRKPKKTPLQLPQQAHIRWDYLASKGGSDVPVK